MHEHEISSISAHVASRVVTFNSVPSLFHQSHIVVHLFQFYIATIIYQPAPMASKEMLANTNFLVYIGGDGE
jgi:hypothetical protein